MDFTRRRIVQGIGAAMAYSALASGSDRTARNQNVEYGQDTLAIHEDALQAGDHVLLVDDLLATGGTMAASAKLVETLGAKVMGAGFVIELTFLPGRERLKGYDVFSLIQYDAE